MRSVAEIGTRSGLAKATLTSYVVKSTLAGQSGRFAFAELPRRAFRLSKHRRSDLDAHPRALGRSGEAAHFVSRAAGSARRGGSHLRCMVTANRLWFLRKASARTALLAALQKATLTSHDINRLWPDNRAASPSLNAQARVQTLQTSTIGPRDAHPRAWVQVRPYQRKD